MKKESKIVARVTHEQRLQYIALGGSKWLRRKLTEAAPESALAQKVQEVIDERV